MKQKTFLQKTRWWFVRLLTGWKELPSWWCSYGYAWKDAAYSLVELLVLALSPLISVTAPFWAFMEHINERRRVEGEGE